MRMPRHPNPFSRVACDTPPKKVPEAAVLAFQTPNIPSFIAQRKETYPPAIQARQQSTTKQVDIIPTRVYS